MEFKDHFSRQAANYLRFRPTYPSALFAYLASLCPLRKTAWDCATGNGQAAHALTEHFEEVIATDASAQQISLARPHPNIRYCVVSVEKSGLAPHSVDLTTVAQALHWFDFGRFYKEVRRVVRPGGILAVWCYDQLEISPAIDVHIRHYYYQVIWDYWPPERRWIEEKYQTLPFPFPEIAAPDFAMTEEWRLADLLGYLHTWSATQRYIKAQRRNPLIDLEEKLRAEWGETEDAKKVRFPLYTRLGRVGDSE